MNSIQIKNQIIRTYKIKKISLSFLMIKYTPKTLDMID